MYFARRIQSVNLAIRSTHHWQFADQFMHWKAIENAAREWKSEGLGELEEVGLYDL